MGDKSRIAWTNATVNFFTGCTKISEACDHCYAKGTAEWLQNIAPTGKYRNGFDFTVHVYNEPNDWTKILRSKTPKKIFIDSMSDIFHEKASFNDIKTQFEIMNIYSQHIYQLLTKRTNKRTLKIVNELEEQNLIKENMWMGVTIELQRHMKARLRWLNQTPFKTIWVSAEPLLGLLDFTQEHYNLNWIVTGGESGTEARPMNMDWIREIRDYCSENRIAFFHKQHGGTKKCKCHGAKGCLLVDNRIHKDFPRIPSPEIFF